MANLSRLLTGLVVGAAVGAAAGLLLAPRPGKETRRLVATRAGELRQKAGEYVATLRRRRRGGGRPGASEQASDQRVGARAVRDQVLSG